MKRKFSVLSLMLVSACLVGCGGPQEDTIHIDGSSTVYKISQAVAEEYMDTHPGSDIQVGLSGTGGGFQKFAAGEIAICDASRQVKDTEIAKCKEGGFEMIELEVAYDGLAVVVHPDSPIDSLTVAQLKQLWEPDSKIKKWSDLNPEWPDAEVKLFGPGNASGTFDYFTKAIVGVEKASRTDYTASEDDSVLVTGVSSEENALGYFGLAYYSENKDKLKLVAIDNGDGPIKPSQATVNDGTYAPLSRPLYIYVSKPALEEPHIVKFVDFYLENCGKQSKDVGYVPLSDEAIKKSKEKIVKATPNA